MDCKDLIWKEIPGFEGYYQIATNGEIKSIPHIVSKGTRFEHTSKEHPIKPYMDGDGYLQVKLCKKGKRSNHRVHRLVALTFIPNPYGLPEINHKDENKINNHPDNLEWCTKAYNTRYGTRTQRTSKRVVQLSLDGKVITLFNSIHKASQETGIPCSNIRNCALGKTIYPKNKSSYVVRTAGGYRWKFIDE